MFDSIANGDNDHDYMRDESICSDTHYLLEKQQKDRLGRQNENADGSSEDASGLERLFEKKARGSKSMSVHLGMLAK